MRLENKSKKPFTTVEVTVATDGDTRAEFGRYEDLTRLFGIKRTAAFLLARSGKIKAVRLRQRGSARFIKLFDLDSVRAYLHDQMEKDGNDGV